MHGIVYVNAAEFCQSVGFFGATMAFPGGRLYQLGLIFSFVFHNTDC